MTCRFTNTKNPNYLNIAEFADVHLGHNRTTAEHVITSMHHALPDNPETAALDMIVYAGDVFDRLITLPTKDVVTEIEIWGIDYLKLCKKHDIVTVIVEGTPRHDRKQCYLFEHLNDLYNIGAEILYVQRLSVVKLDKFNLSILFVPDEWHPDHQETYRQAVQAIAQAGIDKPDIAVMHGAFDFQFPANLDIPTHDSDLYLQLVREWIFIGHVHVHSRKERILVSGSLDRLTFGEEAPKGHMRVKCRGNGPDGDEVVFVENPLALRYDTIDVEGLTIEQAVEDIRAKEMPKGSNLRLLCAKTDPSFFAEKQLQASFPNFRIVVSAKKVKAAVSTQVDPLTPRRRVTPVDISPSNVKRLMAARLAERDLLPDSHATERVLTLMDGVING
ncbi:hypothetical protein pEaSNUABM54_00284 [Erwinia phage pEa_SNUABM_54]|nr:hypothetical protein pEaSNUABM54_00284 [Erwinia phage pEa_SNUABM_54]